MVFLKGLGKVTGHVIGGTVGGALEVIGELADSDSLKKAGKGVYQVAATSGEVLGGLADGTVTTAHGVITKDGEKVKKGLGDAGQAVILTAGGVGQAIKYTAVGTAHVVHDVLSDTPEPSVHEKNTAEDYHQQGVEKGKRGKYKEAIEDFTQALCINPNYAAAYKYRGLAYSRLGENLAASADFHKAADLYLTLGNTKDYQDALDRALKLQAPTSKPHEQVSCTEEVVPHGVFDSFWKGFSEGMSKTT
jgi:tetratricopeptide (TPR) repeat protein